MVKLATLEMLPQLKELWKLGFGDSMEYIDFVFSGILDTAKLLTYIDKKTGMPVGMLCMEPMELLSGEEYKEKAMYIYGVTTHPRFRGKGIGAMLLKGLHKYLDAKGYVASVLTPASKELFTYYQNNGYETQFAVRQIIIDPDTLTYSGEKCVLVPRALDNLYNLRNRIFSKSGLYVCWSPSYLDFVTKETKLRNGEVLLTHCNNKEGFLTYRVEDEEVVITEFGVSPDCMEDVLYTLHKRLGAKMYKIRLNADYEVKNDGGVLPFAMIKWYDNFGVSRQLTHAPYINHVMD